MGEYLTLCELRGAAAPGKGCTLNNPALKFCAKRATVKQWGTQNADCTTTDVSALTDGPTVFSPKFARLNTAVMAGQRGIISIYGDSGVFGQGSNVGTSGLTGAYLTSGIARLAARLAARGGTQGSYCFGNRGSMTATTNPFYPTPMTFPTGWAPNAGTFQSSWGALLSNNNVDTSDLTTTVYEQFDTLEFFLWAFPGAGGYTIKVDGVLVDTIDANGANLVTHKTYTVAFGNHTVTVNRTGGNKALCGFRVYKANTPCIQIDNFGISGEAMYNITGRDGTYAADAINVVRANPTGSHLVGIQYGGNDRVQGRTAAQLRADIVTFGTAAKTGGADIFVISPVPTDPATVPASDMDPATWLPAIAGAAQDLGCPFLDLHTLWGSYAARPTWYYDQYHPNALGYTQNGDYMYDFITT